MKGKLIVRVFAESLAIPVENATVTVTGENTNITTTTNENGETKEIELNAPNIELSEEPGSKARPYSLYNVKVIKKGLAEGTVENVEIFPNITSYQDVILSYTKGDKVIVDDNALYGKYPSKIPEAPIKPETGASIRVLPEVKIPEYVIVHDGSPTNSSAKNYYVSFPDYIKNVASGEIYPTWPTETLKANIIAIISFTLNRIYTEWYRSKGYPWTITSSPQYDQKYTYGRTIFNTISDVVDQVFNQYLKFPNMIQPFLAQYSDGREVIKDGWLSQWGSKDLGDKGYNAERILKYYYGDNININKAESIEGLPTSYPGYTMKIGNCGGEIQMLQNELNKIRGSYPAIPRINNPNGIFNEETKKAVETFQRTFSLPVTGQVDYATWYKISYYYIAISKMLEGVYS